ncbi:MAG: hypothetical protein KC492_07575, partial [Myxococcales bacterium]|nr:hypothetical protein [Myxococcales bacterium]
PFEPVNGGTYSASADLIGFGLQYSFDAPEKPSKAEQPRLRRKPESDPKAAPLTPTNEEKADDVEELDDESFRGVKPADVDLDESNGKPKGKQPSGKQPETKKPSSKKPLDPKYRGVKPEDVDLD